MRTDPAEVDRLVDFTKITTLQTLKEGPAFCSARLVIDRRTGKGVFAVIFDDADVEQFDLVLAHLHVPELV